MLISFAPGTQSSDLLRIGIDPDYSLACILAFNEGRDKFEAFVRGCWARGDFERVEAWSRRLRSCPFSSAAWRKTLLMTLLADLFDEGGHDSLDGAVCEWNGFEYLEAGDTYSATLTLYEGVLRAETLADAREREDEDGDEDEDVSSEEFEEAYEYIKRSLTVAEILGMPGVEEVVREELNNEIIERVLANR